MIPPPPPMIIPNIYRYSKRLSPAVGDRRPQVNWVDEKAEEDGGKGGHLQGELLHEDEHREDDVAAHQHVLEDLPKEGDRLPEEG